MWPTHYIPNQARVAGEPPPRFYLTTPMYPIELVEELASAGEIRDLQFEPSAETSETMQSHGAPVSGVFTQYGFLTYSFDDELQSAGTPLGGVLVERLVRTPAPTEELASSGTPISGVLAYARVEYNNWPLGFDTEDLQSSGTPISGVLT